MSEKSTYNLGSTVLPPFLIVSSSFLQVTRTTKTTGMSPNFDQIGLLTVELAAIERLEKSLYTYHWRNVVTSLLPLFMNGSSSFLQVIRTAIKAWMSLFFCQIQQLS